MDKALQMISQHAEDGAKLRRDFFAVHGGKVAEAARRMAVAVARGGKILLAGNGGSAADAQHWAAEFVNRFLMDRPPLPAIALTTDSSVLTSIGNDFGYDLVFTKQVQALGRPGDVFVGISTSGNSANVLRGMEAAGLIGMQRAALTGGVRCPGGSLAPLCDIVLNVPSDATPHIQETHLFIEHLLCELVERQMFAHS